MKNIFNIYKLDLKSIVTNLMTAVLVGGLIFLPSLYAWLNIIASWDPYAQTDQIPIGFVNEDKGATIRGEEVHVGKDLEEKLQSNNSFNWEFVDYETGMEQVEYGDLFALIVVPDDFSETLGSVMSDSPKKAEMDYYVNEKINAIAPKITDKGASVLVEEISSEFIATVNGIIFEMFNDIGLELEETLPDIKQFEEYVFMLEEELPNIHKKLQDTDKELTAANKTLTDAKQRIPEAENAINQGLSAMNQAAEFLNTVEKDVKTIGPTLTTEIEKIYDLFSKTDAWQENVAAQIKDEAEKLDIAQLEKNLDQSVEQLTEIETELQNIQDELNEPNENITNLLEEIAAMKQELETIDGNLTEVNQFIEENQQFFADINDNLNIISEINLDEFLQEYNETIEPAILSEIAKGKSTVSDAESMLIKVQNKIPEIESKLTNTEAKILEGQELIDAALTKYPVIHERVREVADKIRSIQDEADLQDVIELLLNDPDAERNFFAEPVLLHKNEVFPIANYGTGMTPFYTVLSLWVGGLLLISLLSANVPDSEKLKPFEVYFGRHLTFITVGICQTLIVTLGDIFIVGVTVSDKLMFVLFGLLISFVFMTIVYTAIAIFGDVGKAIAIILLVLQIASSGGTYPVVLLPEFFQAIHPFLPFTYGVDLMREAVGGIVWSRALKDIGALAIFVIITLLAGALLKGPVQAKMSKVMKSKGGRLFH